MDFSTEFWGVHFHIVFTVKVTGKNKKGKKLSKTLKCAVTVKTPSIAMNQTEATLAVNETVKLTAVTTPKSAAGSVTYTSDKPEIATVAADGTVTAVVAGEATITASAKCGSKPVTATAKVTVKKVALKSVSQTKLKEVTATVAGDTKDLKATDFSIVEEGTNTVFPVTEIKVDDKEKTKVVLTLLNQPAADKVYAVTLDGVTEKFTASDGKVASIALDKTTIPYDSDEAITLVSKDAKGVIVDEVAFEKRSNFSNYTFNLSTTDGSVTAKGLRLNKVGSTGEATIAYRSGKYDASGKPVDSIEETKVTITAVEQNAAATYSVRIGQTGKKYDDLKDNQRIAAEDSGYAAYIKIADADGKEVQYKGYKVKTSNKDVLGIAGNEADINGKDTAIGLIPYKEGTAYLQIEKDGKLVNSVAVTVLAKKFLNRLEIDKTSVTMSNKVNIQNTVTVKPYDQLDRELPVSGTWTIKKDGNTVTPGFAADCPLVSNTSGKLVLQANNGTTPVDAGTYTYNIEYSFDNKTAYNTLTVTVNGTVSSGIQFSDNGNVKIEYDNDLPKVKDLEMVVSNGKAVQTSGLKFKITAPDGTVLYDDNKTGAEVTTSAAFTLSKSDFVVSNGKLTVPVVKNNSGTYHMFGGGVAGTYKVEAEYTDSETNKPEKTTGSFTIENDRQAKAVLTGNSRNNATIKDLLVSQIRVNYNGKKYGKTTDGDDGNLNIVGGEVYVNGAKKSIIDFSITASDQIKVATLYVEVKTGLTVQVDISGLNGKVL